MQSEIDSNPRQVRFIDFWWRCSSIFVCRAHWSLMEVLNVDGILAAPAREVTIASFDSLSGGHNASALAKEICDFILAESARLHPKRHPIHFC
jgi:Ulp1 family protease